MPVLRTIYLNLTMDRITFEIFEPDGKKFKWTPDTIFAIFLLIPLGLHAAFQTFIADVSWLHDSLVFYEIFGAVAALGCLIASYFLREPLKGCITGELEFGKDFIKVNEDRFNLKDITGLDFVLSDYYGRLFTFGKTLNPIISQGIKNHVTFDDRGNQTHLINFRLMGEHSYLSLSDFINEAVKIG